MMTRGRERRGVWLPPKSDDIIYAAPQYKLTASFDFWEEMEIEGVRTEGEMSEAGICEAAKQRRR